MMGRPSGARGPSPACRSLYRLGGAAAWIVALLTVAEIVAFVLFPPPTDVRGWFELFQSNPIIGIVDFWGLEVPMYAMFALVFLALFAALNEVDKGVLAIAVALAMLGIAVFFATNNPFSMLTLSRQFADATTEASRSALMAAGEAILATTNQRAVGGFNISLFLISVVGLIVSWVMRKASTFRRLTAYLGIAAFAFSLADYARQALTTSVAIALLMILPGAVLLVVWFMLVGGRLWQLGQACE